MTLQQTNVRGCVDPEMFDLPATGGRFSRQIPAPVSSRVADWGSVVVSVRPTQVYSIDDCGLNIEPANQHTTTTSIVFVDTAAAQSLWRNLTLRCLNFPESTSPFSTASGVLVPRQARQETALISEILLRVRAHFSVNTSELARVLGVERPTIYSWGNENVALRKQHRARLLALDRLVRLWTRLSPRPLGPLKTASVGSRTLIDLLSDASVSENTISEALRELARRPALDEQQTRQRSIAELARDRGWRKVSPERTDQTLRSLRRT